MAGSFSTPSSTSHGSRPTMPFRASTTPDLSTRLALSSTFSKASSTQQPPAGRSSLSLASVHDLWIEGLTQYTGFRLHAALSTFKRILRELRSSEDELPSPTTSIVTCTEAPILTPEEATLLYINIGLIHGYLGSYYLSAAAFEEALLIDDASGIAWFGLGIARFYLRELGASKRAFGTCQRCFVVRDENGEKHQKEELSYRTWIGQSPPVRKPNTANEGDDPTNAPSPRQEFKGILGHGFPNGLWKLERARVEWNWRIALFERNHVRKGIERPGGGKWGLNGIPAGLIFGPNSVFESHDIAIRHRNKEEENANVSGLAVTVSQASTGEVKGRTGSLVKRKWSLLQQRVLKKPITLVPSLLHRRTKSSESFASSNYSNNEPTSIKEDDPVERASPPEVSDQYPGILKRPMPPTPPLTPYQLRGPYDDEWEKEIRKQSETSPRPKPPHAPIPCLFPPRRSSLIIPSTRYSPNHRRFLRGTLLAVNTAIQSVERIDEESPEQLEVYLKEEWPVSATSADISPKSLIPRAQTDDIMMPNLIPDLVEVPAPPAIPSLLRTTVTSSQWGSDSFMTDNISPLSSQMRSTMFPSFSDAHSSSAHLPSSATDVWNTNSDAAEPQDNNSQGQRRPSAIVTFTPATPEKAGQQALVTATILDDFIDSYYLGLSSGLPYSPYPETYLDHGNMTVEPLSINRKGERMSTIGRPCLGEWEWEEVYKRWRQGDSTDHDEEVDDTVGEMLLPRRFEGFGTEV